LTTASPSQVHALDLRLMARTVQSKERAKAYEKTERGFATLLYNRRGRPRGFGGTQRKQLTAI